MSQLLTDDLSRLQNQSHIPATVWCQWCNLLKLDPIDAVDVWEEICHPIMVATHKIPEVPYILQMRVARLELDIFDFKEEVPKVLHVITFLYALKDERLIKDKTKSALLKFYRKTALQSSPEQPHGLFLQKFLVDLCAAILVAKVLPAPNITLAGVLKPIVEGHSSIDQIIGLGLKVLNGKPYADRICACLAEWENAVNNLLSVSADDEEGEEEDRIDDGDYGEEEEGEDNKDEEDADDADDEEEGGGDEGGDALEVYLVKFKNALHAIYERETELESELVGEEDETRVEQAEALLDERLKAIGLFRPLQATAPSIEEAQAIAKPAEAKRSPHKPVIGIRPGGGGGGGGGSGGSGGGGALAGASRATAIKGGDAKTARAPGESAHADVEGSVEVAAADMVEPEEVSLPGLSSKVHEIAKLLVSIELNEQQVWGLVIDPLAQLQNLRTVARQIGTAGTGAYKAYNNVKQIARYLKIKDLLNVKDLSVHKDRNFMLEIRTFINSLNNDRKIESDSSHLAPLKRILDYAAAALVRLEALKTNFNFSTGHPESYTREAVTLYYEEALRALTDFADPEIRGSARQKADADTDVLLAIFSAEEFVEKILHTVRDYVTGLRDGGHSKSVTEFKAACGGQPIEFEGVEYGGYSRGAVPDAMLATSDMGDVFDEAYRYVTTEAWGVMEGVHQPKVVAGRIKEILREILVGTAVFTPEMRRHMGKPTMALAVVGLDKITGNINLKEYYVRLRGNGEIAFIEDFEDGKHVDLFEMREYKPSRVHTAVETKKDEDGTEELQTGRKYLFTIGRTDKLFGDTANDLVNGCIRGDDGGGPKAFNVF